MAKEQAEPMWLARDKISYVLSERETRRTESGLLYWPGTNDPAESMVRIIPAQSPVELEPGGGPVKVWLADEREHAIAKAPRMLVRSTKDGLDIVASGYYDEIAGLVEDEA